MPEYPYVDLDLLREYALKIDYWSRSMVDTMRYSVSWYTDAGLLRCDMKWNCDNAVYYIVQNTMICRNLHDFAKDRPTITWDEFVEMSSPREDFSEQLAALLGI